MQLRVFCLNTCLGFEHRAVLAAAGLGLASMIGCNSGPPRVTQAYIDPGSAGDAAIEQYDANDDGIVNGAELDAAPGLRAALRSTDKNGDGGISSDELATRVEEWQASRVGLTTLGFTATLDGKALEEAVVTFEPEAFLGDEVQAAVATTDMFGSGGPTIPPDQRPTPTSPPGVSLGIYKVKISKVVNGKESIPAKYNENTSLGIEVAPDVSEILNRKVKFALTTK